ncbi:MAG: TM2 domain-containing protein, partial [Micrococcales bacterium]|nr:TM2 domain-containing protein [Micrococcales bacterium]
GLDRLYLGKIGTAVLKFVTCGGLGVWYLIDLILVLVGRQTDRHGCFVTASTAARVVAAVITVVLLFGGGTGATVTYDASPAPGVVEVTAVS